MAYEDGDYTPWESDYPSADSISEDYQTNDTSAQYNEPNTYGYGQTSNMDQSQYDPYQTDWQDNVGITQNQSFNPQAQPEWYQNLLSGAGTQALPQVPQQSQNSGMTSILSQLFGGGGKLLAGLMEGAQNKKKQQAYNQIAKNPSLDPFATERPFYQQQARQAVIDPYSSPMVKAQIDNVQREQNIRDAAAGRRSNMISSQPGVMAAQAKIAQSYLDQMLHAGGSQQSPDGKSIAAALMGGANAGVNGYASPLASALGYTSQASNNNDQLVNALKQLIANGK